ncbi:MAG: hypothetical protein J0G30_11070 [Actinomycetales bacterium]|nr:hypothetical protein [Actinomycetales bacterium]
MTVLTALLTAPTLFAAEEAPAPIIMPPLAFAAIAAGIFVVLGFVTWSFRDVANRHSTPGSEAGHDHH